MVLCVCVLLLLTLLKKEGNCFFHTRQALIFLSDLLSLLLVCALLGVAQGLHHGLAHSVVALMTCSPHPLANTRTRTHCLPTHAHTQVMVFFSSCSSVKYHAELLNYIDIPVKDIHGKQKQQKRTATFFEFCQADKGILLCTDVAARGLDIPGVCVCACECVHVQQT